MTAITQTTWTYTCKVCAIIRNSLIAVWCGFIAFSEAAGRARAARELTRMGYHAEAKSIMLENQNK